MAVTNIDIKKPTAVNDAAGTSNSNGTINAINKTKTDYAFAKAKEIASGNTGNTGNTGNSVTATITGKKASSGTSQALSGLLQGLFGNNNNNNQSGDNDSTSSTVTPDTTVEDSYKEAMTAANDRLKQAYEYQQSNLEKAKNDALREAYIKQQMVERAYPEQLASAGINGGAAQGVLARNNADYANQRTSIQGDYLNNLGEAGQTYQQGILQNEADYLANMAAYRQELDKMRREWELEQLTESGLLNKNKINGNSSLSGLSGLLSGKNQMTAQDYLNSLRNQTGTLFK